MHHKEQHLQAEYYKKITHATLKYNHVIVFGLTDAKLDLLNILDDNALFDKIDVKRLMK